MACVTTYSYGWRMASACNHHHIDSYFFRGWCKSSREENMIKVNEKVVKRTSADVRFKILQQRFGCRCGVVW